MVENAIDSSSLKGGLLTKPKWKCALSRIPPAWEIAKTSLRLHCTHTHTQMLINTHTHKHTAEQNIPYTHTHTPTPVHKYRHCFSTQESPQESKPWSALSVEVSEHTSYRSTGGGHRQNQFACKPSSFRSEKLERDNTDVISTKQCFQRYNLLV